MFKKDSVILTCESKCLSYGIKTRSAKDALSREKNRDLADPSAEYLFF